MRKQRVGGRVKKKKKKRFLNQLSFLARLRIPARYLFIIRYFLRIKSRGEKSGTS